MKIKDRISIIAGSVAYLYWSYMLLMFVFSTVTVEELAKTFVVLFVSFCCFIFFMYDVV